MKKLRKLQYWAKKTFLEKKRVFQTVFWWFHILNECSKTISINTHKHLLEVNIFCRRYHKNEEIKQFSLKRLPKANENLEGLLFNRLCELLSLLKA